MKKYSLWVWHKLGKSLMTSVITQLHTWSSLGLWFDVFAFLDFLGGLLESVVVCLLVVESLAGQQGGGFCLALPA